MKLYSLGLVAIVAVGVTTQPFSCFPRMKSTPSIKPYEKQLPEAPKGTVPFAQDTPSPTRLDTFAMRAQPVPATRENVETGGVYYTYYCEMCHGPRGAGDGTVGHSYVPVPPPLNTARVRGMAEAPLLRAMLTGRGHDPVLTHTVAPDRRAYLLVYLRSLQPGPPAPSPRAHGPPVPVARPRPHAPVPPPKASPMSAPAPRSAGKPRR